MTSSFYLFLGYVNDFNYFFRLENGWFVRDVPSPVQSGGTSSLVSSSPPSENEFELNLNHNESSSENYASSSKSTKKVLYLVEFRLVSGVQYPHTSVLICEMQNCFIKRYNDLFFPG